jgi:hypothetical protein
MLKTTLHVTDLKTLESLNNMFMMYKYFILLVILNCRVTSLVYCVDIF